MAYDWANLMTTAPKLNNQEFEYVPVEPTADDRSILDRIFAPIQNTSVTNALYNMTDGNPNTGIIGGIAEGFKAMNPMVDNVNVHYASDVLSNLGWNPQSLPGKIGKGVVGFAGDVLLDPMSYVNPISAGSKIIRGTGTVVKGAKGIERIKGLSAKQAQEVIDSFYASRNIDPKTLDPQQYLAEIEDLQNKYNKKILHIAKGGEDFKVGTANLPFASKIKVPGTDKTLDTFTKTLASADTLRNVGDKTIAPYYNALAQKIRNTKALQKFNKYADLDGLMKTNPIAASSILKVEELIKGFDNTAVDNDLDVMDKSNILNTLSDDEKHFIINFFESGDWKAYKMMRSKIDDIRQKGQGMVNNIKTNTKSQEDLMKELDDIEAKLKPFVETLKKPTTPSRERVTDFGNDFYANRILEYQPSAKLEVAEVSPDTVFKEMLDNGEFDNDVRSYMKDIIARDRVTEDIEIPQELTDRRNEILFNHNQSIKELADIQKYRYAEITQEIQSDMDNYNRVTKLLEDTQAKKQKDRIPALVKRQEELKQRIISKIELSGGDKKIFDNFEDIKQSVQTAKTRLMEHKADLLGIDDEIKTYKLNNKKDVAPLNVYNDEQLLKLGKENDEVLTAIRTTFDEPKKGTKEYKAIDFTNESKIAVVDELNQALFGKRERPVIQYDIDSDLIDNIMKAIEKNDVPTALKLLKDPVMQYNWDGKTFDYVYHLVDREFPFKDYGLDVTSHIRNTPVLKKGKNKSNWQYFKFTDVPELIARYENGEKELESTLKSIANDLNLVHQYRQIGIDGGQFILEKSGEEEWLTKLKNVKSKFWHDVNAEFYNKSREIAEKVGARDMRLEAANRRLVNDMTEAYRRETKDPFAELPMDKKAELEQWLEDKGYLEQRMAEDFDYRDMGLQMDRLNREDIIHRADDITDAEYKKMYDYMSYRIQESLGKTVEKLEPEELGMFRDIDDIENAKFGIRSKLVKPLTQSSDIADEYIAYMKQKGKDIRYPEREINKYDNILNKIKENGDVLTRQALEKNNAIDASISKLDDELRKNLDFQTRISDPNVIEALKEEANIIKSQIREWEIARIKNVTNVDDIKLQINKVNDEIEALIDAQATLQKGVMTPSHTLNRYYVLEERLSQAVDNKKLLTQQLDSIQRVKKVRERIEARVPITNIERNNFYRLSPQEQKRVARDYKTWQENRFIKGMEDSTNEQLLAKINSPRTSPEVKAEYEMFLNRRLSEVQKAKVAEEKKQQIINSLNTRKEEIQKQLEKFDVKNANDTAEYYLSQQFINDELARQFGHSISDVERIMSVNGNNKLTDMMDMVSNRFNEIAEKEIELGHLKQEQYDARKDKYIPHLLSNEGVQYFLDQITKEHNGKFNPETFGVGIRKKFDQKRTYETLDEANEALKKLGIEHPFELDLADIFQARAIGHNQLLFNTEMTKAIRDIFGKEYKFGEKLDGYSPTITYNEIQKRLYEKHKAMGGTKDDFDIDDEIIKRMGLEPKLFSPNMQYIKVNEEQIKKIAQETSFTRPDGTGSTGLDIFHLRDEMHDRLNRESRIQKQLLQSDMLNMYDKFLYMYKMWNSAMFPGFHIQNAASNAFQSFMSKGSAILEPERYKQAHEIYAGKNINKTINYNGHQLTYKQVRELADKYGILDNTFFNEDIVIDADPTGFFSKHGLPPQYDPTDLNNFIPYREGKKWGANIEGTQRLVLFIKNLEEGKSIKDAVDDVNHFMFDYSDLTDTEKDVMKRVIPFYTYMRKNVPLQLEQLLANPWLYAGVSKAINNIESMSGMDEIPDSERNEWKKDYIQLPTKINGEAVGINPQLPYQQLERLSPSKIIGQMTPLIKTPVELLRKEYAYTGIPIEGIGDYMASQTIPTRVISQGADKEGADSMLYNAGQIIGFPMGTITPEDNKNNR